MRNKDEVRNLKELFKVWNVDILHISENISVRALLLVTDFGLSHSLRLADALIAATAIEHQHKLVTANDKHYRCVPMLDIKTFRP
ncbi:MAG: PIN domain-containing protein [Coriobacteriia bacterium]|nr:PIN domain-containing protein [Coriobacteriia bacterium]